MSQKRLLVAVVAIGCGVWGAVHAQDAGGADGGELEVQQPANLSAEDKVAGAKEIVARATRLSERVTNLLNDARRDADMIRVTCLNDKLTQINANLRNAEGRLVTLTGAVDPGLQDHEFTVIGVLGQKFKTLDQEASQCVGQEVYETGTSTNTTKVDPRQAGGAQNASSPPQPPPPPVVGAIPPPKSPNT